MKAHLLFVLLALSGGSLLAQDFVAPTQPRREIVPVAPIQQKPTIEGIVKEIFVTKKPWQAVNPAAPAKYGNGEKNISKDTGPGTPFHSTGWVLVAVEW